MGGLNRSADGVKEVAAHRVKIHRPPAAGGERRDDCFGIIAGTVEAPVNEMSHTTPERIDKAAVARVETATATGEEENGNTLVVKTARPPNTPTSTPVTIR